ncbi:DUF1223 domain-containing protein [Rhodoligotrophos defluvii]|uniref:DUF1223 domain-containing protein n=1 Tax=Rhodoligotrophos defluvii TaxID=2561934 RepID=UPI0014855EEC|nr:DUF1223 domain-containing protein [Rhodoligotrophos defluvii]
MALAIGALLVLGGIGGVAQSWAGGRAVLELFTSQGCSSCPPADKLLHELAQKPGIVALTYNVDYWDYLGWKDTLATPENSRRQREYAERRGDREVYTPQLVIDGRAHAVGSRRDDIERILKAHMAEQRPAPSLTIDRHGRELEVSIGPAVDPSQPMEATVWLMMIQPEVSVSIQRGENLDKQITYTNVVRRIIPVAMWHGEPLKVSLPASELATPDTPSGVVLVQEDDGGPIIAATDVVVLKGD